MDLSKIFENSLTLWLIIIIISLLIGICLLTWMFFKREKHFQLVKFSLSTTGINLTYELDKDKRLELLALENNALRQEVRGLQTTNSFERWRSVALLIIIFIILIFEKKK